MGDEVSMKAVPGRNHVASRPHPHDRPAFYAADLGGWRDYLTLLHPPYTLWHLSYVVFGAALAPSVRYDRLGATLLAFFLAVGIAAHALDELSGRPLRTHIPDAVLRVMAAFALAGAVALGIAGALLVSLWLLPVVAFGVFIVPAYNVEWFRGRFHTDLWFALAWGVFPFLTAYWVSAERLGLSALFGALAVLALSLAQRALSNRVRTLRRKVDAVHGTVVYTDGSTEAIDKISVIGPDERALALLSMATVALSVGALVARM
jgi:hypothetical protein